MLTSATDVSKQTTLVLQVTEMKRNIRPLIPLMRGVATLTVLNCLAGGALAEADPEKGADVFKKCAQCHSLEQGKTVVGPSLKGVIGRQAGALDGYSYSNAMKKHGVTWDAGTLDVYLTKPSKVVPGTKMGFAGLPSPDDRANLIAYLLKAAQ